MNFFNNILFYFFKKPAQKHLTPLEQALKTKSL